ncbi:MAG TPA: YciI family protein [Mycobacteriales bacterium]|jgi:hypothetical protein|nr:YciI family protein [Mycobacteriales bacterium]
MRFMMMVKADDISEAGGLPSEEDFATMGRYNEELVKAGVLLAADGLHPSSEGALVSFSDGKPTVLDGPFTEAKELVAGYWVIAARSKEEAVEWARRAPIPSGAIEIRQIFEAEDFGEAMTPELREQNERLRAQAAEAAGDQGK